MPDDGLLDFCSGAGCLQADHSDADRQVRQGGRFGISCGSLLRRGWEMHVACERADRINLDGEELVDSELSVRVSAKK